MQSGQLTQNDLRQSFHFFRPCTCFPIDKYFGSKLHSIPKVLLVPESILFVYVTHSVGERTNERQFLFSRFLIGILCDSTNNNKISSQFG